MEAKTNPKFLEKSFNLLGHIYNPLKRVFLGNQPEKAISKSIPFIESDTHFLVVGSGADNTVIELVQNKKCEQITHVDISSVLSKKGQNRFEIDCPKSSVPVNYVVQPFLEFNSNEKFDAIVFPFYLDVFAEDEVRLNIAHSVSLMENRGKFYVIDFISSEDISAKNRMLIKLLYVLFYPFTTIKRSQVPDYKSLFGEFGLVESERKLFCSNRYSLQVFTFRKE